MLKYCNSQQKDLQKREESNRLYSYFVAKMQCVYENKAIRSGSNVLHSEQLEKDSLARTNEEKRIFSTEK